jgi:hypothetical protein
VLKRVGQVNKIVRHRGEIDRVIYYMDITHLSMPCVSSCEARTPRDAL